MKKVIVLLYRFYNKVLSFPAYLLFFLWKVDYGKKLGIVGLPVIQKNRQAKIYLGDRVKLTSKPRANLVGLTNRCILACNGKDAEIIIDDDSGLSGVVINARNSVRIGKRVLLGGNVRIFDHDFHELDAVERFKNSGNIRSKPVIIENDVFIGTNSIILKGSHIGSRSIIGAGSVVSGNIPADEIWGGNPAKFIKKI